MTAAPTLQQRLTELVLAHPDVHSLYLVQPAPTKAVPGTAGEVADSQSATPMALVSATDTGTAVTVSIGITGERPAPAVCRDVHDRIAAELTLVRANVPLSISVRIASVT